MQYFVTRLFVSERKQIALMAEEKSLSRISIRLFAISRSEMEINMFGKRKEEMMIYVVMGFLEAGKTSLIRDLIVDDMFDDRIKTLILACEEGEEEFEEADLKKGCAVCEYIEDEESFMTLFSLSILSL